MTTYFTGAPCRNGHIAPRYIKDKRCVQCKVEKDARHYAIHAEKVKARAADWYRENHAAGLQERREYHAKMKHDPAYQAPRKSYMEKHRDRLLAIQRTRSALPEVRAAKAAQKRAQADAYLAHEQNRRARQLNATPRWFGELDDFVLREAAHLCGLRFRATAVQWQVDHMIPLQADAASGLHCAENIQVIPRALNAQKNNKMVLTEPSEWITCLLAGA